jgi:predicted DNA-binding mobile mystery protein A
MNTQQLAVKQLDEKLNAWQQTRQFFKPSYGWIRTLRKTLGMTTAQLALRLGVHRSRVIKIEEAEKDDALTLRTLRQVAEALNCDLVYALVPRQSLQNTIKQQANLVAKQQLKRVAHSMALEDQAVNDIEQYELLEEHISRLLSGPFKYLWREK